MWGLLLMSRMCLVMLCFFWLVLCRDGVLCFCGWWICVVVVWCGCWRYSWLLVVGFFGVREGCVLVLCWVWFCGWLVCGCWVFWWVYYWWWVWRFWWCYFCSVCWCCLGLVSEFWWWSSVWVIVGLIVWCGSCWLSWGFVWLVVFFCWIVCWDSFFCWCVYGGSGWCVLCVGVVWVVGGLFFCWGCGGGIVLVCCWLWLIVVCVVWCLGSWFCWFYVVGWWCRCFVFELGWSLGGGWCVVLGWLFVVNSWLCCCCVIWLGLRRCWLIVGSFVVIG